MKKEKKAIVLLSGGLDSFLACRLILDQKISLIACRFSSFFYQSDEKEAKYAEEFASFYHLPFYTILPDDEYFALLKNPIYGYGKGANPCIDCKIYLMKRAAFLMKETGSSFLVTGEVVGQRPFSQQLHLLKLIEKASSLEGKIVRPLSAGFLSPSEPERDGTLDRTKFPAIRGRSRREQLKLAALYGITNYTSAGGGCLLTEKIFGARIKELFLRWPHSTRDDIYLIKHGRVFWKGNTLLVMGRDQEENTIISSCADSNDILLELEEIPSPLLLIRGSSSSETVQEAKSLLLRYAPKARETENPSFRIWRGKEEKKEPS
ncbi:MAG: hypothetical protein WDA18_06415 [Candidatus Ratteibacteria bacterium]